MSEYAPLYFLSLTSGVAPVSPGSRPPSRCFASARPPSAPPLPSPRRGVPRLRASRTSTVSSPPPCRQASGSSYLRCGLHPRGPPGWPELLSVPHRKGFHTHFSLQALPRPRASRLPSEQTPERPCTDRWASRCGSRLQARLPPRQGCGFGSTLVKPAAPGPRSPAAPGPCPPLRLFYPLTPSVVKFLPKLPQPFLLLARPPLQLLP